MKTLPLLLTGTLLFTACSKTVKEVHDSKTQSNPNPVSVNNDILMLKNLLKAPNPNLALADLLVKSVTRDHQLEFKQILAAMPADTARNIIESVQRQNENVRLEYMYHNQNYGNDEEFISLVVGKELALNVPTAMEQLKISTFVYIKNQAVDNIVNIYQKEATKLSNDVSLAIAVEIANKDPQLVAQIEGVRDNRERIYDLIKNSKVAYNKIDEMFKLSNTSERDQYRILIVGLVAGGIYTQLAQHKDFQHLVKEAKKVIEDVKKFEKKVKEVTFLAKSLGEHLTNTVKNAEEFKSGLEQMGSAMKSEWERHSKTPTDPRSKDILSAIYDTVNGKKDKSGPNISVLSGPIQESFKTTVTAAGNMAGNLSSIIQTTEKFMTLFGVGPSNDLAKALKTAGKVASIVGDVSKVAMGYLTGGPVGAFAALGSSSLLGGGGDSAQLAEISKKLDVVIKNQAKIMEMQVQTMNMIKELALMVDTYHRDEMNALAELRDYTLTDLEINKAGMNQQLSYCETIIKDRIKVGSTTKLEDMKLIASIKNISNLSFNKNRFNSTIKEFNSFIELRTSDSELAYSECQRAFSIAFNGNTILESPVRGIFDSTIDKNLMKYENEVYKPMLSAYSKYVTNGSDSVPLHLPASTIKAASLKKHYVDYANTESGNGDIYLLDELISTHLLERYVTSLLILHPVMELDRNDWTTLQNVVEQYLTNKSSRSFTKLENALKLTQSAIAQEVILSGEPILHKMHKEVKTIVSQKKCVDNVCYLRENRLFMKNLIMYSLNAEAEVVSNFNEMYRVAYEAKDFKTLAYLFNTDLDATNFEAAKEGTELYLKLQGTGSVLVRLPTPQGLVEGKILYSENVPRLNLIQTLIIDELQKVAPVNNTIKGEEMLNVLLLGNVMI